jgi:CTP synthase
VIYKLRELRGIDELGGTMRLGAWTARLKPGSFAHQAYGTLEISERHRHRYEFNREYEEVLVAHGLEITGATPDGTYVEIVEIRDHPWFLGCQFHPEFKSRPLESHPLFKAFIGAAAEYKKKRLGSTSESTGLRAARAGHEEEVSSPLEMREPEEHPEVQG